MKQAKTTPSTKESSAHDLVGSADDVSARLAELKPGAGIVIPDLPMTSYHSSKTGASKSGLHTIYKKTPFEYKWLQDNPKAPSSSLTLGTLFHSLFLEPEKFETEYAVWTGKTRRGKAWEEFEAIHQDKTIVTASEHKQAQEMLQAALKSKLVKRVFDLPGEAEYSHFCRDADTGVVLKCRPDKYLPRLRWVIDVKTAANPLPVGYECFQKDAYKFGYYVSAALSLRVMESTLGVRPAGYYYLVVANASPYRAFLYRATDEEIALGDAVLAKTLPEYAKSLDTGVWTDYEDKIYDCGLPPYAKSPEDLVELEDISFEDFRSRINAA